MNIFAASTLFIGFAIPAFLWAKINEGLMALAFLLIGTGCAMLAYILT